MNKKLLLFLIMLVAIVLRFYKLGEIPPHVNWDEAAIGYNAYSLIETGKDEYGTRMPLVFRSFDDYKPPLYFYLAVPSVYLFGLNEFAVRLPSALFGTLTVLFTYLLVGQLIKRNGSNRADSLQYLPLIASFLLAISPWHVHFSKIAFEANVGVFFNVAGVYFFLRGIYGNGKNLIVSAILFALALYTYHSERVFVPLLLLLLAVIYRKELIVKKWNFVISIIIGTLLLVPLVLILLNPANLTRIAGTSSFSDQTGLLSRNITKLEDAQVRNDMVGTIFANRRITYAQVFINGYLSHFNINWLFVTGDQERHHVPGMGLLYFWELPLLVIGLYKMAESSLINRKSKLLVFGWFLISPVAASITTELPHAIRTIVFLPTFQIFSALGLLTAYFYVRQMGVWTRRALTTAFVVVVFVSFLYFTDLLFVHLNRETSKYWQYGYKQAVAYTQENYEKYDRIVVSTKLEQPHIFFLFFLQYDPIKYLREGGTYSGGFAEDRNAFEKYEFRVFTIENEINIPRTLYIGTPDEIPGEGMHHINYLDGTRAMEFYEN